MALGPWLALYHLVNLGWPAWVSFPGAHLHTWCREMTLVQAGRVSKYQYKASPINHAHTRTYNNNIYTHQGCALGLLVASASRCKKPALHVDLDIDIDRAALVEIQLFPNMAKIQHQTYSDQISAEFSKCHRN